MDLAHSKFNHTIRQHHVCVNHLMYQSIHHLLFSDQVHLEDAVNNLHAEELFQNLNLEQDKLAKDADNADEEIMFQSHKVFNKAVVVLGDD